MKPEQETYLRGQPRSAGFLKPEEVLGQIGIKEGMKVADFGCGAGYFAIPLAERVGKNGKVYAIDIQSQALESVRSRSRIKNLQNITAIWADLEIPGASKLKENSLDAVLITNLLFQAERRKNIIQEALFVLQPQGILAILEWKDEITIGPPQHLRVPKSAILNMARSSNFYYEREIDLSSTHYCLLFRK